MKLSMNLQFLMFTWKGEVYTSNPFNPTSVENIVNLKIRHNNIDYYTDTLGDAILSSNNGQATYYLEGLYSQVMTNGSTPSFSISFTVSNVSFDNTNSTIPERTAYGCKQNSQTF